MSFSMPPPPLVLKWETWWVVGRGFVTSWILSSFVVPIVRLFINHAFQQCTWLMSSFYFLLIQIIQQLNCKRHVLHWQNYSCFCYFLWSSRLQVSEDYKSYIEAEFLGRDTGDCSSLSKTCETSFFKFQWGHWLSFILVLVKQFDPDSLESFKL